MRRDNHKIEDRILLKKACCEACSESLSIIYTQYRKPVCDYLYKAGVDGLAEDICQIVFTQIAAGQCHYDSSSDVKSYLFGIAGNIRNKELAAANKETYGLNWEQIEGDLLMEGIQSPVESLERSELRRILEKEIANLPPKTRQAIESVYLEGIPAKEAAKIANCDFNTFRTRLNYGLQSLRKSIKKDGGITIRLARS